MKLYKEDSIVTIQLISNRAKEYFDEKLDINEINSGVDRNTYISLGGSKFPPSFIYKKWAESKKKSNELINILLAIKNRNDFLLIHKILVDDLEQFWKENLNGTLGNHQSRRLVDLFFKFLARTTISSQNGIDNMIIKYANIPLDKYALMAVKTLFRGLNRFNRIMVSKNPKMDDFEDKEDYNFAQNQIYQLMEDAGLPNLYFYIYASDFQKNRYEYMEN
jgi:hypothetical protein